MKKFLKKITPQYIKNVIKSLINIKMNVIEYTKKPLYSIIEKRRKKTWLNKDELSKYRKKIKIYDAFNFFNELEILDIRLNILNEYVDYFVIVESTLTHSGLPKELFYEKNKNLFKKFEHKIIHYVIDNSPKNFEDARKRLNDSPIPEFDRSVLKEALSSDNVEPENSNFLRDFYEKEYIKKPLIGLSDDDFCFVSDLDEIWDPEMLIDYSRDDIFKPQQDGYIYYLNNRTNEINGWTGTIGTKYKNIKNNCLNHLRTRGKTKYVIIKNGGWHFSFQGGVERVKTKIESYSHQEINNKNIKSQIEDKLIKNRDIRGRHIKFWKDETKLPKYLLDNKEKYKNLFKN